MNATHANRLGHYVETVAFSETVRAFVPPPLPPDPAVVLTPALLQKLSEADRAIGRLDGISMMLPDKPLFLYMYVRKEAVLSSQIEGTQSTFNDLLRFETMAMAREPINDVAEVSSYVHAMMHGLERMRDPGPQGLPLCLRLLRDMHRVLMQQGRGNAKIRARFAVRKTGWAGRVQGMLSMYRRQCGK